MGGFDVVDGAVAQRVDGEIEGIRLNHVVHDDVGTQVRFRLQLEEGRFVLFREVVHDRHRTRCDFGGKIGPAPTSRNFKHETPAGNASERGREARCTFPGSSRSRRTPRWDRRWSERRDQNRSVDRLRVRREEEKQSTIPMSDTSLVTRHGGPSGILGSLGSLGALGGSGGLKQRKIGALFLSTLCLTLDRWTVFISNSRLIVDSVQIL